MNKWYRSSIGVANSLCAYDGAECHPNDVIDAATEALYTRRTRASHWTFIVRRRVEELPPSQGGVGGIKHDSDVTGPRNS